MKKLVLVALVAATSAFAMTDGKSLVELNGCFDGGRCDNLDFTMKTDDQEDNELNEMNIALNYNYLFTNNFGAGLKFVKNSETRDGDIADASADNSQTIGVNLFWNFAGGWESTYAAVRYDMTTWEESDANGDDEATASVITLEYGKRMAMGKVFGLALHYAPSVSYSMTNFDADDADDEVATNELRLNVANFAVSF